MNWRLSSSSSPFLLLSFSWLLLVFPPCSSMDGYRDCGNRFNCGNITDVVYPFSGEGRPPDCGHPDLKLSCHHGSLTKIEIKQVMYNVLEINQRAQILKISRDDFLEGFCSPKFPNNTIFDPPDVLFEYDTDSQEVTVLYDCPSTPLLPPGVPPVYVPSPVPGSASESARLDCPSGSAYKSAFIITEPQTTLQCKQTLRVGILRSYVNGDMGNLSKMEEAMRQGFAVKYKVNTVACMECTGSGGSCGYNWTTSQSICYCEGHNLSPWETKCPPPPPTPTECGVPFNCGNLRNINYPFWGSNRPNHCGRPEFQLTCLAKIPRISIQSNTFGVLEINQDVRTLKIARQDFWDTICPSRLANTTPDVPLFTFGSGLRNVSLCYGCIFSIVLLELSSPIACETNVTNIDVYVAKIEIRIDPRVGSCNSSVLIPVFESAAHGVEVRTKTISNALDEGFEVRWQTGGDQDECVRCERSGERRGCNSTESGFVCSCYDQPNNTTYSTRPATLLQYFLNLSFSVFKNWKYLHEPNFYDRIKISISYSFMLIR